MSLITEAVKEARAISFMQYDIMFENLWDNEEFKAIVKHDQEEKAALRAQVREMEERGELNL